MPLDDTGFNPDAYIAAQTAAGADRWANPGKSALPRPRNITPRSDAQALMHIWQMLETRWARIYSDGSGNRCIVGWVGDTCAPVTNCDWRSGQIKRVLQRLHDALPMSAQRKRADHWQTLARYNDTHSPPAVRECVRRAYVAEVKARIDALNNQPDA